MSRGNMRHSRSLFGRTPANFAPLPDQSQTISHDDPSCESTARTSGRDSDPLAKPVRSTMLSCFCSVPNLLAQVFLVLWNFQFLRILCGTEMVRSVLSIFFLKENIAIVVSLLKLMCRAPVMYVAVVVVVLLAVGFGWWSRHGQLRKSVLVPKVLDVDGLLLSHIVS